MEKSFLEYLNNSELSGIKTEIIKSELNSLRIKAFPSNQNDIPIGSSKLGGFPDLPADIAWPVWRRKNKHTFIERFVLPFLKAPEWSTLQLYFLAQINLAEVREIYSDPLLPDRGILYFFFSPDASGYSYTHRGSSRVIYREDLKNIERVNYIEKELSLTSYKTKFIPEITLAPSGLLSRMLKLSYEEREAYEALSNEFLGSTKGNIHRLMGYPEPLQNSNMQLQSYLAEKEIEYNSFDYSREKELGPELNEWILLLQIGDLKPEDEEHTKDWGDSVSVYFWIKRNDLLKRNFENVWAISQYI